MSTQPATQPDQPAHLTKQTHAIGCVWVATDELKDREFWCRECHARVTQSTAKDREYGHVPSCTHSIRHTCKDSASEEGADDE